MITDKNARPSYTTLTHGSLSAQVGKRTLTGVKFFFINLSLLLDNILVLLNFGAFASVSLPTTGDLGISPSHASRIASIRIAIMVSR